MQWKHMLLPGGLLDIRGMLDWGVFKGIPLAKLIYYHSVKTMGYYLTIQNLVNIELSNIELSKLAMV